MGRLLHAFRSRKVRIAVNATLVASALTAAALATRHFLHSGWPLSQADPLLVTAAGLLDSAALAPAASVAAAASERGSVQLGFALVAAAGIAAALVVFSLPRLARVGWIARFKVGQWLQQHCACRRSAWHAWLLISVSWALRGVAVFLLLQALSVGASFPLALAFLCASAASAALPTAPVGAATQAGEGAGRPPLKALCRW